MTKSPSSGQLTLVVPTRNRPLFIQRMFQFYQDRGLRHPIVIADSSGAEAGPLNRQCAAAAGDRLQVDYQSYDPESDFLTKVLRALCSVDTEYVVFGADDDFFVPSTLDRCVAFLQKWPDYAIAHGRAAIVNARGSVHDYPQRSVELINSSARLYDHLAHYTATWYSVHRRKALIANLEHVAAFTPQATAVRFGELLPSCLSLVQGKSICLGDLYMIRQDHATSGGKTEMIWPQLLTSADYSGHYIQFRGILISSLVRATGCTRDEAKEAVDVSFRAYLSNTVARFMLKSKAYRIDPAESTGRRSERLVPRVKRLLEPIRKAYARHAFPKFRHDFTPAYDLIMRYPNGTEPSLEKEAA